MARKKKSIVSVESVYPDTLRIQDDKYVTNFVSYESDIYDGFKANSRRGIWNESKAAKEIAAILEDKEKVSGRRVSQFFFNEEVEANEVEVLSERVKLTDKYIYRVRDWSNVQWPKETYGTEKEALAYIEKKIKNKYVHLLYNGMDVTMEFNIRELSSIMAAMAENTNPILISQVTRGEDEYWYEITIFKNNLYI